MSVLVDTGLFYNLGTEEADSVDESVAVIDNAFGTGVVPEHVERPSDGYVCEIEAVIR